MALTPTWSESAYFADYVLPMGLGSERHDLHSYETHDAQWLGFRQPVLREAKARLGQAVADTREVNPGEVWEENEFWIELSWRIDPDGAMGIRKFFESRKEPGKKLSVDEYYGCIFENSVPGLPEKAKAEGLTPARVHAPLRRVRGQPQAWARCTRRPCPRPSSRTSASSPRGRVYTRADEAALAERRAGAVARPRRRGPAAGGRRGRRRRAPRLPDPEREARVLLLDARGVGLAGARAARLHPEPRPPVEPRGRARCRSSRPSACPVQIHTRSANAKWLDEIAHTNPLWLHPSDAATARRATRATSCASRRAIGHFVVKAWVTEGIRPGVVACSHHMGRWKLEGPGQRQMMATVSLTHEGTSWTLRRETDVEPFASADPDTSRIWWTDAGVHQNLTFPVQPDPISGMHCWHQAVRVKKAAPGDRYGDVSVDTAKARRRTRSGSPAPGPRSCTRPTGRGGRTGCCARSSPAGRPTGCPGGPARVDP